MNTKTLALLALPLVFLAGCASQPEPDTRVERTALTLQLLHAERSGEDLAEFMADEGLYEEFATSMVEGCDKNGDSFIIGFKAGLNDPTLQYIAEGAWDIACPE